jgi:hypothetical protein
MAQRADPSGLAGEELAPSALQIQDVRVQRSAFDTSDTLRDVAWAMVPFQTGTRKESSVINRVCDVLPYFSRRRWELSHLSARLTTALHVIRLGICLAYP